MNITQLKILELSSRKNIWAMKLREVGKEVGINNRGQIKYHLDELVKRGLLKNTKKDELIKSIKRNIEKSNNALIDLPILGLANCGVATLVADEMFEGYLKVAPGLIPTGNYDNLFVVKAEGDSLNKASINGYSVENGDYLIIDTNLKPQNGNYVLSVIEGCANVKKYHNEGDKIVLESESTEKIPPIFIDKDTDYLVNGVVIKVVKIPRS